MLGDGRAHIITNEAAKLKADGKAKRGEGASAESFEAAVELRVSGSVGAESELAAALPMRLSASALSSLVVLGSSSKAPSVLSQVAAVTFTVNSTADTGDATSDGNCADSTGNCTLRAAIEEVSFGTNTGPCTINFNIPGAGVPTITTSGEFSGQTGVRRPVVIDGTTQAAGRVEIIGQKLQFSGNNIFRLAGGNSTVRGFVLRGDASILVNLPSGNNIIKGCYFSIKADGTTGDRSSNSEASIYVIGSNNRIGGTTAAARNVISGSNTFGIKIDAGTGNLIQGNYVGTNAAGTAAIGNRLSGITTAAPDVTIGGTTAGAGNLISGNEAVDGRGALNINVSGNDGIGFATVQGNLFGTDASGSNRIGNDGDAIGAFSQGGVTTIGGTTPAARNIISGSGRHGLNISATHELNPSAYVQGNYIGTSQDGTVAMPNLGNGILLGRFNITIGGVVSGTGNLISGNGADGINVTFYNHVIQGNLIGTDVSGTLALPNQGDGIETFRADATLIGGTTPEARNVISGNRENGLRLQAIDDPLNSNNRVRVQANYIGTNRFGTGALGNGQSGVFFGPGNVYGYDIGGTSAGAGNLIAHNVESGIASERNYIGAATLSNSIHSNGELGIDIADNGVSSDSTVYAGGVSPTLTAVTNTGAGTVIEGTIRNHNSSTPFTIQFFSNPACNPSGHGEGQT